MIEVEVHSIRVSLMSKQRMVLLKELNNERYVPIWIGEFESDAINIELQERRPHQRPFTHDLMKSIIEHMGGRLIHILINDVRKDIYYARLVIEQNGETLEVDSRPSDAIALAVRFKAPIFVAEVVMDKDGVVPEEDVYMDLENLNWEEDDEDDDEDGEQAGETSFPSLQSLKSQSKSESKSDEPAEAEEVDESQLSAFADFLNTLNLDELDTNDDN